MIRTGLEIFCTTPTVSGPVGLLANVSSQTATGHTALTALRQAGVDVAALFSPEHGYFGLGAAGEMVADDQLGDLSIHSLYNYNKGPASENLRGLSALLVDLQDTGNRWFTYATTLRLSMKACAGVGIPVIVLDRPNPQSGVVVEGNIADPEFYSMVIPGALPTRHALTIGELARFFNASISADLFVTIMDGWKREMLYADTGLPWVSPSPNMPHALTTLLYSGTCLLEGTNLSEGRGTALPFEQIGAPFIDAEALTEAMQALGLPGLAFTPAWFRPTMSKYRGEVCQGVRVIITDAPHVRGFALGIHLICTLKQLYPDHLEFINWADDQNGFDALTGSRFVRAMIESGQHAEDILALCNEQADDFQGRSTAFWIYEE